MFPRIASHIILTTQFTDTANHKSTKTADKPAHASRSAMWMRASAPSSKRNDASTNRADLSFASHLHWLHLLPISLTSKLFFFSIQAGTGSIGDGGAFYLREGPERAYERSA